MTDPIADMLARIRNGVSRAQRPRRDAALEPRSCARRDPEARGLHRRRLAPKTTSRATLTLVLGTTARNRQRDRRHPPRLAPRPPRYVPATTASPRVRSGLGIAILSTSRGVMSDQEAREQGCRRRAPLRGLVMSDAKRTQSHRAIPKRRRQAPDRQGRHGQGPQGQGRGQGPKAALACDRASSRGQGRGQGVLVFDARSTGPRRVRRACRALVAQHGQGRRRGLREDARAQRHRLPAEVKGKTLNLALGFSHPIVFPLPKGITARSRQGHARDPARASTRS